MRPTASCIVKRLWQHGRSGHYRGVPVFSHEVQVRLAGLKKHLRSLRFFIAAVDFLDVESFASIQVFRLALLRHGDGVKVFLVF